jgi:sterol desaturase/sphingolipid hydroxylase (fatty acid hydroxylase superfamily)
LTQSRVDKMNVMEPMEHLNAEVIEEIGSDDSARDFVRRLGASKFNYWFGYVANLSLSAWLASQAFYGGQSLLSGIEWIAYAVLGVFLWSFTEYLVHRFGYHEIDSFFSLGHKLHHEDPKALIGVPWWVTAIVLVGIYYGIAALFDPSAVGALMCFFWLGYIFYCITHHAIHHWSFNNAWFKARKRNHLLHHYHDDVNIGIWTNLWDHVLGTYRK